MGARFYRPLIWTQSELLWFRVQRAMKERANTVAAFVPGYVEDFEDLEDFEPEGVTAHNNSQKEAARREEELSGLAEAGRRAKEREEAESKAKEELKEKEEKELKAKEEAEKKLEEEQKNGRRQNQKPRRS